MVKMAATCRVIHRETVSTGKGLLVPCSHTQSGRSSLFVHAGECTDQTSLGIPKIIHEVWARGGSRAEPLKLFLCQATPAEALPPSLHV